MKILKLRNGFAVNEGKQQITVYNHDDFAGALNHVIKKLYGIEILSVSDAGNFIDSLYSLEIYDVKNGGIIEFRSIIKGDSMYKITRNDVMQVMSDHFNFKIKSRD